MGWDRPFKVGIQRLVDMAPDGTIYGIELLNANEQFRREDAGRLIVVNESTGKTIAEVPLA